MASSRSASGAGHGSRSGAAPRAPTSTVTGGKVQSPSSLADHSSLLQSSPAGSLVVLLFTAAWHPPCKQMSTVFEQLAKQFTHATFAEVDLMTLTEERNRLEDTEGIYLVMRAIELPSSLQNVDLIGLTDVCRWTLKACLT